MTYVHVNENNWLQETKKQEARINFSLFSSNNNFNNIKNNINIIKLY